MPPLTRLFILAATLALAWPSAGHDTPAVGTMNGTVRNLNSEADIIFAGGERVHLWGLKITDIQRVSQILSNKTVACSILSSRDDTLTADCLLLPSEASLGAKKNYIDLFTWLVEFGVADYHCSDFERNLGPIVHARGYRYTCEQAQNPTREQIINKVVQ